MVFLADSSGNFHGELRFELGSLVYYNIYIYRERERVRWAYKPTNLARERFLKGFTCGDSHIKDLEVSFIKNCGICKVNIDTVWGASDS